MKPRSIGVMLALEVFVMSAGLGLVCSAESTSAAASRQITSPAGTSGRRRAVSPGFRIIDRFRDGSSGWTTGFADYSTETSDLELDSGIRPLPPELGSNDTALLISGYNRSDDLFMFLKKKLSSAHGIRPGRDYEISFRILFASRAGSGCSGIGGAPGESVFLKAGGSSVEPQSVLGADLTYRMNVDKGNQGTVGPAASVAGDIANGATDCSDQAPFRTLERRHTHTSRVRANEQGELWLLVGTDSGYEGKTTLYYREIEVGLSEK